MHKYSYEITSFLFFLTPEKRVEKDNFLIETTYATYSRMILEKKSTSIQKNY